MRAWEDPLNQERLCDLLRSNLSLTEAVRAMGKGFDIDNLRRERKLNRRFDEQVHNAMAAAFNPVMRRMIEVGTYGDTDDPATLKAWELVTRHYDKALDREHDHTKIDHIAEQQRQLPSGGMVGLSGPKQAAEFIKALALKGEQMEVIDVDVRGSDSEREPEGS